MPKNASVLWTGGKDSSLAFYEARLLGYKIVSLVTFVPDKPAFRAHPLAFMKYQADALGLPHYIWQVSEPFKKAYEKAIYSLRKKEGIDTLITGDIARIDGYPNWIKECSAYADIDVLAPLWGCDRLELLTRFLAYKFKGIFSCVKKPWFTDEWLGMELNKDSLDRLCAIHAKTGLDISGEEGEYHTLVTDGPLFKKSIHISAYTKHTKNSLMYIDIQKAFLMRKIKAGAATS